VRGNAFFLRATWSHGKASWWSSTTAMNMSFFGVLARHRCEFSALRRRPLSPLIARLLRPCSACTLLQELDGANHRGQATLRAAGALK